MREVLRACHGTILADIFDLHDDSAVIRVTGKFKITLPKRLIDAYGIRVGDEVALVAAGDSIAIVPARSHRPELSTQERLRLFDATSQWLDSREWPVTYAPDEARGWAREELYERGRPR